MFCTLFIYFKRANFTLERLLEYLGAMDPPVNLPSQVPEPNVAVDDSDDSGIPVSSTFSINSVCRQPVLFADF